jgi:hypothetical protein
MDPNRFIGKMYDGQKKDVSVFDSKKTKLIQQKIFNERHKEYNSQNKYQFTKPNFTVTLQKPVQTLYLNKSDAVHSQLKNIVKESVVDEIKPIKTKLDKISQISYLEQKVNHLDHEIIQLKKKLSQK